MEHHTFKIHKVMG